jgi:hypothetical protein
MELARAINQDQSQRSIGTTTTKLTGRRNSMEQNVKCHAVLTEWINTEKHNENSALFEMIVEDINTALKNVINRSNDEGTIVESAHVFLKKDLTDGQNIRFYVTTAGKVKK